MQDDLQANCEKLQAERKCHFCLCIGPMVILVKATCLNFVMYFKDYEYGLLKNRNRYICMYVYIIYLYLYISIYIIYICISLSIGR